MFKRENLINNMTYNTIFRSYDRRKELIGNLNSSSFDEEFSSFLSKNILTGKYIEDSFEAAIRIRFYNVAFLNVIKDVLVNPKNYLTKLTVLDYLLFNVEKIGKIDFMDIHSSAHSNHNELVSFQIKVNESCFTNKWFDFFLTNESYGDPAFYYRLSNSIACSKRLKIMFSAIKDRLILFVKDNNFLTSEQITDIAMKLESSLD